MRYYVTVEGRTLEVDLTGEAPRVDGTPVAAELTPIPGTSIWHLLADDRVYTVVAHRRNRHLWDLHLDGVRLEVDAVDERTRTIRTMTGQNAAAGGHRPVRAPMPGLVVRVNVDAGERVSAGQSVAIIEAMKMENDLKAERDGVVSRIAVSPGQPVEKGAVLVEFEAEAERDG